MVRVGPFRLLRPLPGPSTKCVALVGFAIAVSGCQAGYREPVPTSEFPEEDELLDESLLTDWPMMGGGPGHLRGRPGPPAGTTMSPWTFSTSHRVSGLAYSRGTVFAGTELGPMYAIDASDGSLRWSYELSAFPEPVVGDGLVFVGKYNTLTALRLETGAPAWNFSTPDILYDEWNYSRMQAVRTPAYHAGLVVLPTSGPTVFALNVSKGAAAWAYTLPEYSDADALDAPAVVARGQLLVGSSFRTFVSMDSKKGTLLWQYNVSSGAVSAPGLDERTAIVARNDYFENVVALDIHTGFEMWKYRVRSQVPHPPLVHAGRAYFYAWDNYVHALDAETGEVVWRFETGDIPSCVGNQFCIRDSPAPAINNGILFVPGLDGVLYGLDADKGSVVWTHPLVGSKRASPLVVGDYIYGGIDSQVYAIRWRDSG